MTAHKRAYQGNLNPWHYRTMKSRFAALALAAALPLSLGACSEIQDTASSAASTAAAQAKSKAEAAAKEEVRQQICTRVSDGKVSAEDKQVLSGLVSGAESAGVPADITTPLRQIAESGDQVPAEAASKLNKACSSPVPPG